MHFLTFSCIFLRPNEFEQLEFKLEKNIGIYKQEGKVREGLSYLDKRVPSKET